MRIGILSDSMQGSELRENKRLIEEIEESGHEPVLVDYSQSTVHIGPEGRFLYDQNFEPINVDSIIVRIGRLVIRGTTALRLLNSQGIYSTASPDAVLLAKDKLQSQIELDKNGIPTPYSAAPTGRIPEDTRRLVKLIQKDFKLPLIIKNRVGSKGREVKLVESMRSAVSVLDSERAASFMIQEFIEAPEKDSLCADYRLVVVDKKIVAAMKRQAADTDEFRSNLAKNGVGTAYEPTQRETEIALKAADVIGLTVAGVDIMSSSRGPLVTELNVSPEFGIEAITQVNVARAIVNLAIKNTFENMPFSPITSN